MNSYIHYCHLLWTMAHENFRPLSDMHNIKGGTIMQSVQSLSTGWMVWDLHCGHSKGLPLLQTCPYNPWGPTSLLYNGYWRCFLGVKWLQRGIDQPCPFSPKVRNKQRYTSIAPLPARHVTWRPLHFQYKECRYMTPYAKCYPRQISERSTLQR
jgi:hypothetical protein